MRSLHPIRHDSGRRDCRYVVCREFCGYAEARFVARFCDEWIGQGETYEEAVSLAEQHNTKRMGEFRHEDY